jgi:hypothetical protein
MKRFLKKFLAIFIVLILAIPLGIIIWYVSPLPNANIKFKKGGYGHLYSRLAELDTTENIEVLFLGSSHTYRGFNTQRISERIGFKCFNLGSSGQTPDVTKVLLKSYLNEIKPKLVVYEVVPSGIFNESIGSRVDLISNLPFKRFNSLYHLEDFGVSEFKTLILAVSHPIFKSKYHEPKNKGIDEYKSGGYVKRIGFGSYSKQLDLPEFTADFDSKGFKRFLDNLAVIRSQGIPIMLVLAPTTSYDYSRYPLNLDSAYSSLGLYFNFNQSLPLDDSLHFFDDSHLNSDGVEMFNDAFIQTLCPIIDTIN